MPHRFFYLALIELVPKLLKQRECVSLTLIYSILLKFSKNSMIMALDHMLLDCVLCHGTNSIQCTCWLLHIYGREELSLYFGIMREQNELHTVDRIYLRIIILDLLFCQNIELMLWICFGTKYAQYLILRGCYYTSYLS